VGTVGRGVKIQYEVDPVGEYDELLHRADVVKNHGITEKQLDLFVARSRLPRVKNLHRALIAHLMRDRNQSYGTHYLETHREEGVASGTADYQMKVRAAMNNETGRDFHMLMSKGASSHSLCVETDDPTTNGIARSWIDSYGANTKKARHLNNS
jgi:hypothetical protein